jgi:hypothetical protein
MKLKKRHYKMALCAGRCHDSSVRGLAEKQIVAIERAVNSVWFWNLAAAKIKGYK